jgi:hypothetical protein
MTNSNGAARTSSVNFELNLASLMPSTVRSVGSRSGSTLYRAVQGAQRSPLTVNTQCMLLCSSG